MPVLRVALAQVDITVGDLAGNAAVILDRTAEACAAGADLVLFPELAITGYPPEDLVFRSSFRARRMFAFPLSTSAGGWCGRCLPARVRKGAQY